MRGFIANEDVCADCEHPESQHGDGVCRVEQCGCLEFSDKPFTCYHCKAGQCAQCVGAACHCDCLDYEQEPGIKYGTLGVPLALRREPSEKDFADPRFEVIWELIKRVDVDFRNGLFSGATGNDVCAVLDALDQAK